MDRASVLIAFAFRQVSRLVREQVTRRASHFDVVLDDVSITHVAFSPEFTHAVEAKQIGSSRLVELARADDR